MTGESRDIGQRKLEALFTGMFGIITANSILLIQTLKEIGAGGVSVWAVVLLWLGILIFAVTTYHKEVLGIANRIRTELGGESA